MSTPFNPLPCPGGGGGADALDVEGALVCDVDAGGQVVGTALVEATYDATGLRTGTRLVNVLDGATYVPVGTVQPCRDGCCPEPVVLCDLQPDGSSVQFIRAYTGDEGGNVDAADTLLDGSPYAPTGTVGSCDPYRLCTPSSDQDLGAECGPGESVEQQILLDHDSAPLANSVFNDDASADPLCGGTWDRPADELNAPFPVNETFRNTTFDQPGPVLQGTAPYPDLTADVDGAGAGWLQVADINSGTNGLWQVPSPFPTAEGMNAAITFASHDGTTPGGDGMAFVFTDGGVPAQGIPVGGFGNLGLQNWQGGYVAVVLDEYGQTCTCSHAAQGVIDPNPGPCGFCTNTISIQLAGAARQTATCACCTIAVMPLAPKALNQTTRSTPARLLTSIIEEGGQTFVSASVDWNDGNGPVQYFDRVNVTACAGPPPPSLRMAAYGGSGGSFRAVKEIRDAVARPAGVSNWRAFPITTDAIPACTQLVNITAELDVTFTADDQTAGNGNPEAYLWLVNSATNAVIDAATVSSLPSQIGTVHHLTVTAAVAPAEVPNLRVYVGAESRDDNGTYSSLWENFEVTAVGTGCPATPQRTLAISAPCPIPVAIVSGGGGEGGGGGTTVVNTPSTFEDAPICMTVDGVTQPGFRREVRAPDGTITVTFLGVDGLTVTPTTWNAGACPSCDSLVLGEVCIASSDFPGSSLPAIAVQSCQDGTVTYLNPDTGVEWPNTLGVVVCPPPNRMWEEILCDDGTDPPTQFRRVYNLTALGSVVTYDEDLDANAYVLVGDAVTCPDCTSCQTLTLCDFGADEPVLITGISTGGTLSNGVTWSGARGSTANFNPQHDNADGSWWGMPSFPNATVAPDTWFFDRPVDVEFSVVIAYSPATGSGLINQVQVPIGSELISSAADYSYDVATGIVTVDSSNSGDCTKVTNPTVANSARFVLRNVTQFTLDFLGQRIAICAQFSNWRFGSIAVTPATTTFLRTICRTCDGTVAGVTDTQADGTTPYIPVGPVGECGTHADAEPQCFATQICVQPQGVQEFISNEDNLTSTVAVPNIDPVWQWSNDPVAGPWFNMYDVGVFPGWVTVDPGTTQGVANWVAPHPDSSPNTSGLPGEGPTIGPGNAQWYARAQFTLPANADPASIKIAATVLNADQLGVEFRLNNGAWQPVNASHVDPPFSFPAQVIPGAQAGLNEVFVHVTETVFGSGAAGVKMHLIASYALGDQQSWTQIVCDDGTVSYFTNAGEQTDALPEDWVIVPCGGSGDACPCVSAASIGQAVAEAAEPRLDVEQQILCDANGTRFVRVYPYADDTGAPSGAPSDFTLAGAPFVPVGAVGICSTPVVTDFDFAQQVLCDSNNTPFIRRFTFNSQTGAVTATVNLTLAGAAFAPVGAVGQCSDCCPQVIGEGCTNVGSGFYTAIRSTAGAVTLIDSVTGAAVLAANIIACPSDDTARTLTAQARLIGDADAPWSPGADVVGTLTSVTMTVLSGTATLTDQSGTVSAALPAGFTATWSAEDDNTLAGPTSIDAVGGSTVVHWTQR